MSRNRHPAYLCSGGGNEHVALKDMENVYALLLGDFKTV